MSTDHQLFMPTFPLLLGGHGRTRETSTQHFWQREALLGEQRQNGSPRVSWFLKIPRCACVCACMHMCVYVCFPYLSELHFCHSPFLFFLTTHQCATC